jgi:hypothetical protein
METDGYWLIAGFSPICFLVGLETKPTPAAPPIEYGPGPA